MYLTGDIRKLFALLLALCLCIKTYAAKDDPVFYLDNVTAGDSASQSASGSSFTIPFSRAGNLLLIKGRADSTEGNFILDTGSPGLVLNITYFRHYNTRLAHDEETSTMTGSPSQVHKATIKQFSFGSVNYNSVKADLINLGHLENSKGIKILGLLGMEFLRKTELIIDYEKNLLHFHFPQSKDRAGFIQKQHADTSTYSVMPFELYDNRILVKTTIAGKKLNFIIDCGAEINILDSRLPDKLFENVSITGRTVLRGAGNARIEAVTGELQQMKLGDRQLYNLPVLITNLERTCFSYNGCVDGILGSDFLSLRKIGFNFVTRKLYLWK